MIYNEEYGASRIYQPPQVTGKIVNYPTTNRMYVSSVDPLEKLNSTDQLPYRERQKLKMKEVDGWVEEQKSHVVIASTSNRQKSYSESQDAHIPYHSSNNNYNNNRGNNRYWQQKNSMQRGGAHYDYNNHGQSNNRTNYQNRRKWKEQDLDDLHVFETARAVNVKKDGIYASPKNGNIVAPTGAMKITIANEHSHKPRNTKPRGAGTGRGRYPQNNHGQRRPHYKQPDSQPHCNSSSYNNSDTFSNNNNKHNFVDNNSNNNVRWPNLNKEDPRKWHPLQPVHEQANENNDALWRDDIFPCENDPFQACDDKPMTKIIETNGSTEPSKDEGISENKLSNVTSDANQNVATTSNDSQHESEVNEDIVMPTNDKEEYSKEESAKEENTKEEGDEEGKCEKTSLSSDSHFDLNSLVLELPNLEVDQLENAQDMEESAQDS